MTLIASIFFILLLFQVPSALLLFSRLLRGAKRFPPLQPRLANASMLAQVSVIVPTLNEVERMDGMLTGLSRQTYEVREIIIVDSDSQDGTREKVTAMTKKDPRFKLISDPTLPCDWVGRPWALHNGFLATSEQSKWVLGVDADTQPQAGLIASLLHFAETNDYDLLSLSPQFILKSGGEWWLQPALLMTLLYRFESSGVNAPSPETVMANGQCFLIKREILAELGGYEVAKASFCDDVTLAREVAKRGYKVGFADGARLLKVRMYEGFADTWHGWGRSLDLKDASSPSQLWSELGFLALVQGFPLLFTIFGLFTFNTFDFLTFKLLFALNIILLIGRWALVFAISSSYEKNGGGRWLFWLSPTADILAVARIFLSALSKPKQWRGRMYG